MLINSSYSKFNASLSISLFQQTSITRLSFFSVSDHTDAFAIIALCNKGVLTTKVRNHMF